MVGPAPLSRSRLTRPLRAELCPLLLAHITRMRFACQTAIFYACIRPEDAQDFYIEDSFGDKGLVQIETPSPLYPCTKDGKIVSTGISAHILPCRVAAYACDSSRVLRSVTDIGATPSVPRPGSTPLNRT